MDWKALGDELTGLGKQDQEKIRSCFARAREAYEAHKDLRKNPGPATELLAQLDGITGQPDRSWTDACPRLQAILYGLGTALTPPAEAKTEPMPVIPRPDPRAERPMRKGRTEEP